MKKIIVVTGGQRSGKSEYAQKLARSMSGNPVYVATSRVWDDEHRQRIERHQRDRGSEWETVEEEKFLYRHDFSGRVAVIDCVTLWCTNFFFDSDGSVEQSLECVKESFDKLTLQDAVFIFVTNEIGCGGMPENPLQRKFTDLQGWVNQYIASKADRVVWMVSGIPVTVKNENKNDEVF